MQKDILKSISSDLQNGSTLKYYDLVKSFKQKQTTQNADDDIESNFQSVVELLRRTSCFQVNIQQKKMNDSIRALFYIRKNKLDLIFSHCDLNQNFESMKFFVVHMINKLLK